MPRGVHVPSTLRSLCISKTGDAAGGFDAGPGVAGASGKAV